jgi:hypothetical protein
MEASRTNSTLKAPSFITPLQNFLHRYARRGFSCLLDLFYRFPRLRSSPILRRGNMSRRLTIAAYNERLAALDLLKELGEASAGIR